MVGNSGATEERFSEVAASVRSFPSRTSGKLPLPPEANVSAPGCALAKATNSLTLFAGTVLWTIRTFVDV